MWKKSQLKWYFSRLQRYATYLVESVPKAKAVQTHFVADYPNRPLKRYLLYYINGILFHIVFFLTWYIFSHCEEGYCFLGTTYWSFVVSAEVRQTWCHPDLIRISFDTFVLKQANSL